jgi:hypothetical protein
MSWKNRPDQSGVYYIRVYNQSTRYWRYRVDDDLWINLESFQNNDSFKVGHATPFFASARTKSKSQWRLDQISGQTTWRITPFTNPSIGIVASPKQWANGNGIYWFHGFAEGKRGPSAAWRIIPDANWST